MALDHIEELINPEIALSVYDKVFTARTGYDIFFTPQIPKKGIVVPAYFSLTQMLENDYVSAFQTSVEKTGEDTFYVSLTERIGTSYKAKPGFEKEFTQACLAGDMSDSPFAEKITPIITDWLFPLRMAANIDDVDANLEKAIYSLNGTWGLWFSSDNHMIIGGPDEFVDTFFHSIGFTIDEMALRFVKWVQNEKAALNHYLPNLFGVEQAQLYKEMYESTKG